MFSLASTCSREVWTLPNLGAILDADKGRLLAQPPFADSDDWPRGP